MQESLKSVIAQYNASQLLTMREVSFFNPDTIGTCAAQSFSSHLVQHSARESPGLLAVDIALALRP